MADVSYSVRKHVMTDAGFEARRLLSATHGSPHSTSVIDHLGLSVCLKFFGWQNISGKLVHVLLQT